MSLYFFTYLIATWGFASHTPANYRGPAITPNHSVPILRIAPAPSNPYLKK